MPNLMNPVVKTKWLAALRSGAYTQGVDSLCNNGKYCCLGVLADIAIKESAVPDVEWSKHYSSDVYHLIDITTLESNCGTLTSKIIEWAGLDSDNPTLEYQIESNFDPVNISELNDGDGLTFLELAELIERQL